MTFRQVLDIVWRRRLLVGITILLVIMAALLYARLAPVTYQATTILRYSPAGTSTLSGSSSYGSINLDLDPEYVLSPELAAAAAAPLNDDPTALQAAVSTSLVEGQRINRLELTAIGSTPTQAKDRANAMAQAFVGHLKDQLDTGIGTLKSELTRQQKIQSDSLRTLNRKPGDQLAQANFSSALSRIGQIQTEIATIQGNGAPVAILQPAALGTRQGLSLLTIMLIGITSGLLAGAGFALIRDQFDDHVRSTDDVEEVIGDHVIGDVAVVPRRQLKLAPLPTATRLPTPLNESVRGLRTSLEVIFPERNVAIVVTSAEPGEGKTFVSANLAVAMARAGRSVILVEADLRRPRVHTYFPLPEKAPGFANFVESAADSDVIEEALIDTPYGGLRVLPSGSSETESADLLAGDALSGVLNRLREMADFVLIDSPPGLALADAAILGRVADGVLVITALNRTRGAALRSTLQLLNSNRVNVVGVVVNRSRRATVKSYNQYYHDDDRTSPRRSLTAEPQLPGQPELSPTGIPEQVVAGSDLPSGQSTDDAPAPDAKSTEAHDAPADAHDEKAQVAPADARRITEADQPKAGRASRTMPTSSWMKPAARRQKPE